MGRTYMQKLTEEATRKISNLIDSKVETLDELFTALPEIGEKLGWKASTETGFYRSCVSPAGQGFAQEMQSTSEYHTHQLTDTYLQDGMSGVSEKVIKLLSNL